MIKQTPRQKSQKIGAIRSKHPNRWLLIAVDSIDCATNTPLTGHVIASSLSRDGIYRESIAYKGKKPAMFTYSGKIPQDVAYIFFNHAENSA